MRPLKESFSTVAAQKKNAVVNRCAKDVKVFKDKDPNPTGDARDVRLSDL
jgi:hypothetical protein